MRPQYWFGTVLEIADIIAPVVFLGSLNIWSHNSPHSCFVIGFASFDGGPNPLTPGGSFKNIRKYDHSDNVTLVTPTYETYHQYKLSPISVINVVLKIFIIHRFIMPPVFVHFQQINQACHPYHTLPCIQNTVSSSVWNSLISFLGTKDFFFQRFWTVQIMLEDFFMNL